MRRAFGALDGAGVAWCSLHGGGDLWRPAHDVDLLVAPGSRRAVQAALLDAGFLPLVTFSAGAHVLFLGYERGRRVVIDAVTELSFGARGSFAVNWLRPRFETGAAASCLASRARLGDDGAWVLAPEDEFWALLLNCIVDKAAVADRHQRRLLELLPSAGADRELARAVEASCPPGWTAPGIVEAVRRRQWDELVGLGRSLPARRTNRHPLRSRARWFAAGLGRLLLNSRRRWRAGLGPSVAVLGPDGAGKSTLCARLPEVSPVPCRVVYMGLWQRRPRSWWHQAGQVVIRPLRIWTAYLSGLAWRLRGSAVVFDRYVYDALLPPSPPFLRAKRLYFSVLASLCPDARVALLLDAPLDSLRSRRPEDSPERLEALRAGYLSLAARLDQLEIVDASRDADDVLADVVDRLWRAQLAAAGGGGRTGARR